MLGGVSSGAQLCRRCKAAFECSDQAAIVILYLQQSVIHTHTYMHTNVCKRSFPKRRLACKTTLLCKRTLLMRGMSTCDAANSSNSTRTPRYAYKRCAVLPLSYCMYVCNVFVHICLNIFTHTENSFCFYMCALLEKPAHPLSSDTSSTHCLHLTSCVLWYICSSRGNPL